MEIVCKIVFVYIFKETNIFGKGAQLCHNLGKPSSSERMKLATLFPGTSNATDRKRSLGNPSFDPMLQSINQSQKKKKKATVWRSNKTSKQNLYVATLTDIATSKAKLDSSV